MHNVRVRNGWTDAAAKLLTPAAVLAIAWMLVGVPRGLADGTRGWWLAFQAISGPLVTVCLLVSFMALVAASPLRGRSRTAALVGAAMAAAALGAAIGLVVMVAVVPWPGQRWSTPVLWWANFGETAIICAGAALVHDHRVRAMQRAAALRDVRLQAAGVIRRTAEVRLQAVQARIDPNFLFAALSAIERVHDADSAAGNRLLDNLVTYLRAVVPDLREAPSTVGREIDLARLWLEIRREVVGGGGADGIEETMDARARPFPTMTIIPLADAVLADAPTTATLAIHASCEGTRTTVRVACREPAGTAEPSLLQTLRTRLAEQYGEQVRIAARGRVATVEVDL